MNTFETQGYKSKHWNERSRDYVFGTDVTGLAIHTAFEDVDRQTPQEAAWYYKSNKSPSVLFVLTRLNVNKDRTEKTCRLDVHTKGLDIAISRELEFRNLHDYYPSVTRSKFWQCLTDIQSEAKDLPQKDAGARIMQAIGDPKEMTILFADWCGWNACVRLNDDCFTSISTGQSALG